MSKTTEMPAAGRVSWSEHGHHMDEVVQDALDDPRVGDVFHEMYSYGVQVTRVSNGEVAWRSFSAAEIGRGVESRAAWAQSFRYGDHMPGQHTMMLDTRGEPA